MDASITIGAFAIAVTQIFKDLGVTGHWLKLVCVLVGAFATYMTTYQPALWQALIPLWAALTGTGGVSFVPDLLQKMKSSPTE